METTKLQLIKRDGGVIGHKFLCTENDNEIKFFHEDGDINKGEFHFGMANGVGGWIVIGEKDLLACLKELELLEEESLESKFEKAIALGCIISKTSCSCGGSYAWLVPTGRGSHVMYGCVCHNKPPTVYHILKENKVLQKMQLSLRNT